MSAAGDRVLLIVDLKNQAYKAASSHQTLFSGRTFTGGLYGFLMSVCKAIHEVKATTVVIATDTGPYVRKDDFAGYKSGRKENTDEVLLMKATSSMRLITEFCNDAIACPVWSVPGYEYDDICAWAVNSFKARYDRIVAMTNDSDLYQCFDECAHFALYKGKQGLYTVEDFRSEFGAITRDQWITLLSLSGTHNAVPGIDQIGPVKALKAVMNPSVLRPLLEKHRRVIQRNRFLIELPHCTFPADPGLRVQRHKFAMSDVSRFCARYDINLTAHIVEAMHDIRFKE